MSLKVPKSKLSAVLLCLLSSASALAAPAPAPASAPQALGPAALRHLFFKFGGIFFLDFDQSQKLVNQSQGGSEIVLDDDRNGFRFLKNQTEGVGFEIPLNSPAPVGATVGLDLMFGKTISFDRFVKSRQEAANLDKLRIPSRASDLDGWKSGDNVLFQATGGVGFASGVGAAHVVGAAAYYFAEGDWFLYVEKVGAHGAYVKVTSMGVHYLGVLANSVVTGIGADLFKETDRGFSFRYDLRDPDAARAYEDAVHGNLAPSEGLVAAGRPCVARVLTTETASLGFMRSWYFGVPFLAGVNGNAGHVYSFSDTFNHDDGSRSKVDSGIYVDHTYTGGWLSDHASHVNDFFGNRYVTTTASGQQKQGYLGQYFWAFESSSVSYDKLNDKLRELAAKTGVDLLQGVNIPHESQFGYLNIKFEADLSEPCTDLLMSWAKTMPEQTAQIFFQAARADMDQYFESGRDSLGICSGSYGAIQECKKQLARRTENATQEMVIQLRAMSDTKDTDPAAFAEHFGEFGKQMATNRFTFHQVAELTRSAPMSMSISMEGERISQFKKAVTVQPGGWTLN